MTTLTNNVSNASHAPTGFNHRTTPTGPGDPRRAATDPDDALNFAILTLREPEAQVRRRSVGRTIAEICMDLGATPTHCDGTFWDEIYRTLSHFGANLEQFFGVRNRRREIFRVERDKRPETRTFDWEDRPREAIRQILRQLLGEPSPPCAVLPPG